MLRVERPSRMDNMTDGRVPQPHGFETERFGSRIVRGASIEQEGAVIGVKSREVCDGGRREQSFPSSIGEATVKAFLNISTTHKSVVPCKCISTKAYVNEAIGIKHPTKPSELDDAMGLPPALSRESKIALKSPSISHGLV